MIVVDSSALVAILEEEPERDHFAEALQAASRRLVSTITLYETGIVLLRRRGLSGVVALHNLADALHLEVVPFDRSQSETALAAYARFGKGIDPDARLNMGDCASYALAMSLGAPLLYKGDDFVHTDVTAWP